MRNQGINGLIQFTDKILAIHCLSVLVLILLQFHKHIALLYYLAVHACCLSKPHKEATNGFLYTCLGTDCEGVNLGLNY